MAERLQEDENKRDTQPSKPHLLHSVSILYYILIKQVIFKINYFFILFVVHVVAYLKTTLNYIYNLGIVLLGMHFSKLSYVIGNSFG